MNVNTDIYSNGWLWRVKMAENVRKRGCQQMNNDKKFQTVIDKNTFYFYNSVFQEKYESYINSLNETLLVLKNQVETQGLKQSVFENLLLEKENGLRALLALTGFANESLKRLITVVRVSDNTELSKLLYKEKWADLENSNDIKEWGKYAGSIA